MKNFTLINPTIKGSINSTFKAKSSNEAAINAYKTISAYFSKNVPQFSFTMQEGGNLHHFMAKEKITENGKIKFVVSPLTKIKNVTKMQKFIGEIDTMAGSGRYNLSDDSSSDSSDQSSDYKYYKPIRRQRPIDYWYYYPNLYTYDYYYVPQFIPSLSPYVYIKLSD